MYTFINITYTNINGYFIKFIKIKIGIFLHSDRQNNVNWYKSHVIVRLNWERAIQRRYIYNIINDHTSTF